MKNISFFYLEIFSFLVVKFSIYLNRRVFVIRVKVSILGVNTVVHSTLVISTSSISNNRLSRSENMVPVFNMEI